MSKRKRDATLREQADSAFAIIRACSDALSGHDANVQGAVLADLLATWLAGHRVTGDPKATDVMRETLLSLHLGAVRGLIPINDLRINETLKRRN